MKRAFKVLIVAEECCTGEKPSSLTVNDGTLTLICGICGSQVAQKIVDSDVRMVGPKFKLEFDGVDFSPYIAR